MARAVVRQAVTPDEQRVVGEAHDDSLAQRLGRRLVDRAGVVVAAAAFPAAALSGLVAKAGGRSFASLPSELREFRSPQITRIYASDNKTQITQFYDEFRSDVPLKDISKHLRDAIVAALGRHSGDRRLRRLGLRIPGVDVRGSALGEDVDDGLRLAGEVGRPRREWPGGAGADEDRQGTPFVGRAGKLLTDIIEKGMKLRRGDVGTRSLSDFGSAYGSARNRRRMARLESSR